MRGDDWNLSACASPYLQGFGEGTGLDDLVRSVEISEDAGISGDLALVLSRLLDQRRVLILRSIRCSFFRFEAGCLSQDLKSLGVDHRPGKESPCNQDTAR